jgi:hypothetical protein
MSSDRFYIELPGFSDFNTLSSNRHYRSLPADWHVVICDIRGSTKAIESGRYQDVNTLGAASIAVVQGVCNGEDIPFVFGGDGASFLIPPAHIQAVQEILVKLRNFAREKFAMELLVGSIPVSQVPFDRYPIEVAKFIIAGSRSIALMRGGGLSWAETQIKKNPDQHTLNDTNQGVVSQLQGLSCRWQPLKSQKGHILSILIKPVNKESHVLEDILAKLGGIFGGDFELARPVDQQVMKYKSLWQVFKTEAGYEYSWLSGTAFKRLFEVVLSIWAFRLRLPAPFDAKGYEAQIPSHSDYRKFDDMLRMVLDCSPVQIQKIESYLQSLYEKKQIFYGLHRSDHALMTCLVESLGEGGHIHFIDGGDGGYAIAAKQLKDQLARAN